MPLSYILCFSISFQGLSSQCQPGRGSHLRLYLGKIHFQVCMGFGRIQILTGCQTENLRSWLALGSLPHWSFHMAAYIIRTSKEEIQYREYDRKTQIKILCNIIMEMTSHCLCCILLVRNKSQVPTHT